MASQPTGLYLNEREADLVRQWFDAIQDTNPTYLEGEDFALARRVHEATGQRISGSFVRDEQAALGVPAE